MQVFIKDVKSSNGTFINGERLSAESTESDVYELHTDDIVVRLASQFHSSNSLLTSRSLQEFGIDILTEDTKQVVHHKVAAKVHLVMNPEDAIASSRFVSLLFYAECLLTNVPPSQRDQQLVPLKRADPSRASTATDDARSERLELRARLE